jgi:hypothetical protein
MVRVYPAEFPGIGLLLVGYGRFARHQLRRHAWRPLGMNLPAIANRFRRLAARHVMIAMKRPTQRASPEWTRSIDRMWLK